MPMNRTCLRARETVRTPSKPHAQDFRLAIRNGEERLTLLKRYRERERVESNRKKLDAAIERQAALLVEWKNRLTIAIEARAAATAATREGRLARAEQKRRRKAQARRR